MPTATEEAIAAVWRIESARIVGAVARMVRDVGAAEDIAQGVLLGALDHWPREALPDRPGAWLMTTAKHRALDHLRHLRMRDEKHAELGADLEAREALVVPDFVDPLDEARQDEIGDRRTVQTDGARAAEGYLMAMKSLQQPNASISGRAQRSQGQRNDLGARTPLHAQVGLLLNHATARLGSTRTLFLGTPAQFIASEPSDSSEGTERKAHGAKRPSKSG